MKKRRFPAALLACTLLLGLCACGQRACGDQPADADKTTDFTTREAAGFAIREATYPQMIPYPQDEDFYHNDSFDDAGYSEAFDAWQEARQAQLEQPEGYADSLEDFFPASIRAFLSDAGAENRVCSPLDVYMALAMLAEVYYASSFQGPMGEDSFNKALQDWINQQTGGLLEEQAAGLEMDQYTALALATTVYFQGRWSDEFSPSATAPGVFHAPEGDIDCDFMHQSDMRGLCTGAHFSALAQSLNGGGELWLILPEEGSSPEALLQDEELCRFLWDGGRQWPQSKLYQVNLSLPKFDVSSKLDLKDGLHALGITDVLDADLADFSPATTATGLVLSQAEHAARVTIDEEGCTAAAYTVMMYDATSAPMESEEIDFILDRPFLFSLTNQDGLPLFVGVVNQPVEA